MKVRGNFYFYIIIMVSMLLIIFSSVGMEYFKSKLTPLTLGGIVFILAAIGLTRELLARGKQEEITTEGEMGRGGWRMYLISIAWAAGCGLAVSFLGFIIGLPLYIFSYMKVHGVGWFTAIISAVLCLVFCYGIEFALRIKLYPGLILSKFG